ncbi:MAG: hypothetical protein ACKO37_07945 [Vampirovibrionales bacterium]
MISTVSPNTGYNLCNDLLLATNCRRNATQEGGYDDKGDSQREEA